MKARDLAPKHSRSASGFTLLEVLLAAFVFTMAAVSLVGAIQRIGSLSVDARRRQEIVARLDSMMVEITRNPPQQLVNNPNAPFELSTKDSGVDYHITVKRLEITNEDNAPLQGMYQVIATARWMEGNSPQDMGAETWLYPPLYQTQQ